ncbi:cyclophilin-like fold protein [Pedobacter psychrodurus]|uniref:cyclophilin-like fold protein n=1 Tax=Pedobacter psychrodurus TaxID=2530456 RepID=UPI00292FD206|nr:cyclophilin-like fold protein [Pedobacter psychrodurus]
MPLLITLIMVCSLSLSTSSCGKNNELGTTQENANNTNGNTTNPAGSKMKITIGTAVFTATLSNNSTGNAFKTRLPITLNMTELNSNEKYVDFQTALPSNAANPGTIQPGDILLYGSNTIVLFYKTFSTSYRYTSIARIDNPSSLAAALGNGSITVKFELE